MIAQPFKVLMSFHYYRTKRLDELAALSSPTMIFADSGAYSAGTQGVAIDLGDYVRWVRQWVAYLDAYVNLDVIHYKAPNPEADAEATWLNHRRLEDEHGLAPLPVFHGGEPWRYLERYLDRGHRYIALGGMVGGPTAVMRWLIQCFRMAAEVGAVFHGFGQTSRRYIESLPFYSVDSTSWASGHRYGQVQLWDDARQRLVDVSVGKAAEVYARADLIRAHGINPRDIAERERFNRRVGIGASVIAWRHYEEWLRRRHGPVANGDRPAGLHLYLAESEKLNIESAAAAINRRQGALA